MAAAVGCGSASGSWGIIDSSSSRMKMGSKKNKKGFTVSCVYSSAVRDPYKTLKIKPGASESEVKKAFRRLALKYHPDVCKGRDCGPQFNQIYEAYDAVMNDLRSEQIMKQQEVEEQYDYDYDYDQGEYMGGWEGAWIPSYGQPSYGTYV